MRVALLTEATYPHYHGGVSVWCDQLIRGLPEFDFDVYAITDRSKREPIWNAPDNLRSITASGMWDPPGSVRGRRSSDWNSFEDLYLEFLDAMFIEPSGGSRRFLAALLSLYSYGKDRSLAAVLRSEEATLLLQKKWLLRSLDLRLAPSYQPTLADSLQATDLLERYLRPLEMVPVGADVTHAAANGLSALNGMVAKWDFNTPFILTEHGVYLRERYLAAGASPFTQHVRAFSMRFIRHLTSAAYLVADLITPGNEYNRRWQVRTGAADAMIRPVHNGVDPSNFPAAEDEPDLPTICWVGRVDPLKDLETLIKGFQLVAKKVPQAKLRMFGPTPAGNEKYQDKCRRLISELGLETSASFEGRVPSVADAYRAGSIVALTSISEGFPYTVIEAMVSARATVSTDVGGVPEAVGDAGLLVPPRDPVAFADACVTLLNDAGHRHDLARRARERALELFTLDRFLDAYRHIYSDIALVAPLTPHEEDLAESDDLDTAPDQGPQSAEPLFAETSKRWNGYSVCGGAETGHRPGSW